MFVLSELQPLIEIALKLFLECIHLILLLLDQLGFGCNDFLMSLLHVFLSFSDLKLLTHHLNLMGLGVFLLLSEAFLNFLLVEELRREFESKRQFFLENLAVFFNLLGMSILEFSESLSVFLLSVEKILVPLLIELLVLLNMCLFTLLSLLSLVENQLLVTAIVVLMLKLCNSVLGHLSLHIFLLMLTGSSVVFKNSNKVLDVISGWLLIKSLIHVISLHL